MAAQWFHLGWASSLKPIETIVSDRRDNMLTLIDLPYVKTFYSQKLYLDGVLRRHSIGAWLDALRVFL